MNILIKGGRLVDPSTSTNKDMDILIKNGKIKEISTNITVKSDYEVIDAKGMIVSPGFIDMHVHLREPGFENKEDIESGCKAAVHGGFTSIACMPNTDPVNDNASVTKYIIARAKQVDLCNVYPIASISRGLKGENITEMDDLVQAGAVGFSDDGKCVMSADLFRKSLEYTKMLNVPIIEHPEDHSISGDGQVNEGYISYRYGLRGILNAAEEVIVARDIILQDRVKSKLHLTHISTKGSVDLIKNAKQRGVKLTADATPHHLLLNEEYIVNYETKYKMKPPLRTEKDRLELVKAIKSGVIDCIASDHAPHTRDEKDKEFEYAPFGVIGMETSFPVIFEKLVNKNIISIKRLIELFSTNPAKILNLKDKGIIKPGISADITIINPERKFKIKEDFFYSKANNSPFIGWEGKGVVEYTIFEGRIVYKREE